MSRLEVSPGTNAVKKSAVKRQVQRGSTGGNGDRMWGRVVSTHQTLGGVAQTTEINDRWCLLMSAKNPKFSTKLGLLNNTATARPSNHHNLHRPLPPDTSLKWGEPRSLLHTAPCPTTTCGRGPRLPPSNSYP